MVFSYVVVWDKYERELFKPWSLRRKIVGERIIKVKLSIYTYYLEKLFLQSHTCSTLYYYFSLSLLTYLKVSSIASICRTEVNHVFGSSSVKLLAKSAHEMDVHPHAKDHCFSKISIWKAKKGKISPLKDSFTKSIFIGRYPDEFAMKKLSSKQLLKSNRFI